MKTLAAIPAYESKVYCACVDGLLESAGLFDAVYMPTGTRNLSAIRNTIAANFMRTPFDVLFFIDADVGFQRGDVRLILSHILAGEKFVAGGMPYRSPQQERDLMFEPLPGEPRHAKGFYEVKYVAGGFTAIHRDVFDKIGSKTYADRYRPDSQGPEMWNYFPQPVVDGELLSEAYAVCHLARLAGFRVMLDTHVQLSHWGTCGFPQR